MTTITTEAAASDRLRQTPPLADPSRRVDATRLKSPVATAALAAAAVGAVAMTLGTVVAGRLAENPSAGLVWLLAICLVGDGRGRHRRQGRVGRLLRPRGARLREDLLRAALGQPLSALSEQAVGEVLDRVDDDTHEVGTSSGGSSGCSPAPSSAPADVAGRRRHLVAVLRPLPGARERHVVRHPVIAR
jgi:hypothetical protein